jgi:hypothetical protein
MIIGLAGPAGAGKNAVATILTRNFGYKQASFAEPVRVEVHRMLRGIVPPSLRQSKSYWRIRIVLAICRIIRQTDPWKKPTPKLIRKLLQWDGTDYRRAENPDHWVNQAPKDDNTVFCDVRFRNEFAPCDQVWYVYRPEAEAKRSNHISEQQIKPEDCHVLIYNDGSLVELDEQVLMLHGDRVSRAA